jgi:hypothetical protein
MLRTKGRRKNSMTQCGSLVSHAASEIIRHFLKKWKYPNALFSVNTFLHLVLSGLHLFRSGMKGAGRIVGNIFKLKTRGRAILSEEDYRIVISIPAGATIVLVGGNIDEDPFVKIRHRGRILLMLAEDLRGSGELLTKSALFADQ